MDYVCASELNPSCIVTDCLFLQVKAGFMLNLIGILSVNLGINTWGYAMFDMDTFPQWANITNGQP